MKPLMHWPRWHHYMYIRASFIHLVQSPCPLFLSSNVRQPPLFTALPSAFRQAHFRSGASLKSRENTLPSDPLDSDSDYDGKTRKSRNEKKRDARRAFRWAMDLAKFSPPHIKRILRVASVEQEVYDAVMLVKRLGPDVREGKRRQFNYIAPPALIPNLKKICRESQNSKATKDGDQTKFQALSGSELSATEDVDEEIEEAEYEDDEEDSEYDIFLADRWFDGLINKDVDITKEIYSLSEVDFDRQELRGLVRKVQSIQDKESNLDEEEGKVNSDIVRAERSLTCFLRNLAKQLPAELRVSDSSGSIYCKTGHQ